MSFIYVQILVSIILTASCVRNTYDKRENTDAQIAWITATIISASLLITLVSELGRMGGGE